VFSVFRIGPNNGGHPLIPPEYRITCNDGAGPREICRFTVEPEFVPEWFGAWRNDEWCPWILGGREAHRESRGVSGVDRPPRGIVTA
jgi:hypothetical protein